MRRLLPWLMPLVFLATGVALLSGVSGFLGDPNRHFEIGDTGSIQFVLNTNAAALTSAMSVLIALVLLSVQLTAQRYSFNVIDIFIRNWVNAALIGFFILTINFNLWLGSVLKSDYIPVQGTWLALAMTTICFALLPPYVIYLFDVLRPDSILRHLQGRFQKAVTIPPGATDLARRRAAAAERINQIGDIARTAVHLTDGDVARQSVWILYWSIAYYLDNKAKLPVEWFDVEGEHFRGRHALDVREIEETMTWPERCALDQLREVFHATLLRMHDVNNTVALITRLLGEKAIEHDDMGLLRGVMKFFNTFLRAAVNLGDVRSGYHMLYQYRLLADRALAPHPEVTLEIATRLGYYGDAAASGPLLWMAAASGYDLRVLAQHCHERGADRAITAAIVADLIETVRRSEAKHSPAVPQLHKAVAALGSFFVVHGEPEFVRQLRGELDRLPEEALDRIHRELVAVEEPAFWELTDRVVNFDYLEEDVRAALPQFLERTYEWPEPARRVGRGTRRA